MRMGGSGIVHGILQVLSLCALLVGLGLGVKLADLRNMVRGSFSFSRRQFLGFGSEDESGFGPGAGGDFGQGGFAGRGGFQVSRLACQHNCLPTYLPTSSNPLPLCPLFPSVLPYPVFFLLSIRSPTLHLTTKNQQTTNTPSPYSEPNNHPPPLRHNPRRPLPHPTHLRPHPPHPIQAQPLPRRRIPPAHLVRPDPDAARYHQWWSRPPTR